MLINFTIENWMSFLEPATFSMVATRERQHGERLAQVKKYQMRLLPIAAVYGGNASGKTNLFKAINFAKNFVVKGTMPEGLIPVEPFRLEETAADKPSRFTFQVLVHETIYEFSFAVTRKRVIEEKLVEVLSNTERILYHRKDNKPNFHQRLERDQFFRFAFQGTRDNQLFLTNTVNQKITDFRPIYNWFRNGLELVAPDSRFEPFERFIDQENPLYDTLNTILSQLDTGIVRLVGEDVIVENLAIPEPIKSKLLEDVAEGATVRLLDETAKERFVITRREGELYAKRLAALHENSRGKQVRFDMRHESDGTQRAIDLVPAFLDLIATESGKMYVIDEIDRSLHTLLIRQLIELYLNNCVPETRTQLLFTTHDVLLMDQHLLRRDEMWISERNEIGQSSLISFSEYKDIRYDKDIRKSYLQGRMGGIPRILLTGRTKSLANANQLKTEVE